jgi:predicted O-linked N-acetylglucosamine transferase (SPINDLY family)
VEIAVRLGADADYRADVSERIAATSGVLFECPEAVRELEQVFQRLIREARSP